MDLSDRTAEICVLDAGGEIIEETRLSLTEPIVRRRFQQLPPSRVALEVGTHSPWVSRLLAECGYEVLVANARRVCGWRTRELRYARMEPWYPRVDREDFFRTACAAVEEAVRGVSTARGRRIAERGAIYATLEGFELIRRTRGGAPPEGVKGDR